MAGNRPMRQPAQIEKQGYNIRDVRGHEFQNDIAHDLPLSALSQTPRDAFSKAIRKYRANAVAASQLALETGEANPLAILYALQRKANFTQLSLPYTTISSNVLPAQARTYIFLQNLSAAQNLYVGFGFQPNGIAGIGLRIPPGGFYEPFQVPQNDIFVAGDGVGVVTVLFANG